MKKYILFLLITSLFFPYSCSTDFEIASEWKEITVVYGMLDQTEAVHYIKVNKAFLSGDVSAFEMAAISDSIYYGPEVKVLLEELDDQDRLKNTFELERIDGNLEGLTKPEGIFSNDPNVLYKLEEPLNEDSQYRLMINTPKGNLVSSTTSIIKDFKINNPKEETPINFLFDYKLLFSPADNGKLYDLVVQFNYFEEGVQNGEVVRELKSAWWEIFSNLEYIDNFSGTSKINYEFKSEQFFNLIARDVKEDPNVSQREFVSMNFHFTVGGEAIKEYNAIQQARFGITASQSAPTYSNIDNGIGIFTSRFKKSVNRVLLEPTTIDELSCGEITGHLKFASNPNNPNYPFCF